MINLAAGQCVACRGGEPTLTDAEIEDLLLHVIGWQVKEVDGVKRLGACFQIQKLRGCGCIHKQDRGHRRRAGTSPADHHRVGQGHYPMVDA